MYRPAKLREDLSHICIVPVKDLRYNMVDISDCW